MATTIGKSTSAASGEPLLNVPQSERSDDTGEHSEVLSTDLKGAVTQESASADLHPSQRQTPASTATPEAPLVSTDVDARMKEGAAHAPTDPPRTR